MGGFFAFKGDLIDEVVRQAQLEGVADGSNHRHRQRRRRAKAHGPWQVRHDLDQHGLARHAERLKDDVQGGGHALPLVRRHPLLQAPARNDQLDTVAALAHVGLHRQRHWQRDGGAAVHHGMLAEQNHLAAGRTALHLIGADGPARQVADDLLRLPHLDLAAFDQRVHNLVKDGLGGTRRAGHAAGVQGHVPLLDARRRKRPQSGEVLRQPHRGHDARELRGRGSTENLVVDAHAGVGFQGGALSAHLHGHFDLPDQVASLVAAPC